MNNINTDLAIEFWLVTIGFFVMLFAIYRYFRLSASIRLISEHIDGFTMLLFRAYIVLMIFFLFGYGYLASSLLYAQESLNNIMIGMVFVFGSFFVLIGMTVQERLTECIYSNNIQLVSTLISAVEARDINLKGHSMHVSAISLLIYDHLPKPVIAGLDRKKLEYASVMHDLGKLGVPESILNKPGRLTDEEFDLMKNHPKIGVTILDGFNGMNDIKDWILCHHERMDGNGYYHVPANDIPLASRIICIADSYSAIVMKRSYKDILNHDEALKRMHEASGTQFDPEILAAFSHIDKAIVQSKQVLLADYGG